ncbi:MAG: aminotransferase class III-fold pyridoxal phosphate-dependent enzyme [Verrucomicrobiae bacterium]|nr:aminotransferase class III-fold pyridoxal phosphate-dependent enzyme [Verrucomicrobiae bacterium]
MDFLEQADARWLWHPFTSADPADGPDPLILVGGQGEWLVDSHGRRYLDGNSSIWCNLHGHQHPRLNAALEAQVRKIAHCSFLGTGNEPASLLAQALVETLRGPSPLGFPDPIPRDSIPSRVFFSDNGSCANEIAAKMAVQFFRITGQPGRTDLVAFEGSYHGDTMLNVSLGGIGTFSEPYRALTLPCHVVPDLRALETRIAEGFQPAAIFLESALHGAGGMIPHPPGFMKRVADLAAKCGAFLVCDEVLAGFGRTGPFLGCFAEGIVPDFITLSKGLTGGYLPLAITLAPQRVFEQFAGDYYSGKLLYHGHTYTAHPLACAVALENLKIFHEEDTLGKVAALRPAFEHGLDAFRKMPGVAEVRSRGLIGAIDLVARSRRGDTARAACTAMRPHGILTRPIGNTLVIMPPYCIRPENLTRLFEGVSRAIRQVMSE